MPCAAHTVVPIGSERRDEVMRIDQAAFVFGDEEHSTDLDFIEWDRTFGVERDDGRLIGLNTAFSLGVSVPDGPDGAGARVLPMSGLSWVAVDPGHRRQGVLTAMIGHHLQHLHDEGLESVSGLHASEAVIYGRFGYGSATTGLRLELPRGAALREVVGSADVRVSFETADPDVHADVVRDLYARACAQRPGMVSRTAALDRREVVDPPSRRTRREPLRLLLAERDGTTTGYALLRRESAWSESGSPNGTTRVAELTALDAATAHALWSQAVDFDLMSRTRTPSLSADDPLLHLLVDARGTQPVRGDDLWLRLVDVDRALAARSYGCAVDVVLEVTDQRCPWNAGRWRLSGDPSGATCTATTDGADVVLDVRELGAVYAGGTTLAGLAGAGLVTERQPGAVARASAAFRSAAEPSSPFVF